MTEKIAIREATQADWPTIVDFNRRLAAETESLVLDEQTLVAGVQAALVDPAKARYFVACELDGRIVGQLMHTYEWSDWRNGTIWWLQSVYVLPDFRGQGVFRKLLDFVVERGQAEPTVVGLRLYVENHNEQALAIYRRLGMADAGYRVLERCWRRGPARSH